MSFPDSFARHDIHGLPPAERDAAAAALGLPHFAAFLDSVAHASARPAGRQVRQYLLDLLEAGSFAIQSPVSGAVLQSGPSLLLVDKTVLFAFPAEPEVMLGIGDISQGYPVCALVLTGAALFLPVADSTWGFAERHLEWAAQAIRDTGWRVAPAEGPPILVTGDTNFAHVAWNQLSAFEDLSRGPLPAGLDVLATQQPLGPLRAILPRLPPWTVEALPDTALQARNRPGRVFVPVGSGLLTASTVARIHTYAWAGMGPAALALDAVLAAAGPVLWLSVRTRNRTATNQHALLEAVGRAWLDAVPAGVVLIDGFSRPDDLDLYPDYHRAEADSVLAGDRAAMAALQDALAPCGAGRVHEAVGLTVNETIALGRRASLYFCHHGTVQHKVGWFGPVQGVVHCNRAILEQSPAAWVAAQSAVAVPPRYLPPELVGEAQAPDGEASQYAHLLHHDNYVVLDIAAAAAAVMALAAELGLLTPAPLPHTWRQRLARVFARR